MIKASLLALVAVIVLVLGAGAGARADCKRTGPSALEVTRSTDGVPTEVTTLWASGAWTFVQPAIAATGEAEVRASGCLDAKPAAAAAKALAAIDWTVDHPRIRCRARSADAVVYSTGGRRRVEQTVCGAEQLDEASTTNLATATGVLDAATRASHRPPHAVAPRRSTPALPSDPQQPPTTIQP